MDERVTSPSRLSSPIGTAGEDSLIGELLDRWEDAQDRGELISLEQLCAESPELVDQLRWKIDALRAVNEQLRTEPLELAATKASMPPLESLSAELGYRQLRVLAEGGLGVVYSATDSGLHRSVAVKFIQPRLQHDPLSRQQFRVEAEITARLEHPGVVPLYAIGNTADDQPFYVMRFIQGETLDDAILRLHSERPLKGDDFAGIAFHDLIRQYITVCKTIAYAHNRGVLHRDIKPANVMLGRYGETMVVDWGLAVPIQRDEQARASGERTLVLSLGSDGCSSSGSGAGTPAYMSPEQASGSQELTHASDIFSLGSTLYRLLSGRAPFKGNSLLEVCKQVAEAKYIPLSEVNRHIPLTLRAICQRAMALQPEERYGSALELARDLECWLADEPVSALADSFPRRCGRWLRRHRVAAQVLAIAVVLVAALSSIAAVGFQRLAQHEHEALLASETARQNSIQMAARFAARTVAGEIDLRWRILETEAADFELLTLLREHDPAQPVSSLTRQIQAWLDARFIEHNDVTRATSWLLCDSQGRQLARSPIADTIGQTFAYRDYFHGQGQDRSPGEHDNLPPIEHVHRSMVFRSEATGHDMVAFSVPVWSGKPGSPDRRVLAVLAMTVNVGEFRILESGLDGDQVAVLADTRPDTIDGEPKSGRILHHPRLADNSLTVNRTFRLSLQEIEQCVKLRQQRLTGRATEIPLLVQHRDPVTSDDQGECLAALEPVFVRGRAVEIGDTGWIVIVQTSCGQ